MTGLRFLAAAMMLAASFYAGAQSLKPGLWEIENRMQGGGAQMDQAVAQMQRELANMSPEQRKMVQDMMAKQGMGMGAGGAGGLSRKICMTPEMARRSEIPVQQDGNCKQVSSSRSGNTMKFSFTCADPASSGEGTVTFVSPEAFQTRLTVQTGQGSSDKMSLEGSGKWLSADCGGVKPRPGR